MKWHWLDSTTVAFGINVPKALGLREQAKIARLEGSFICPEGAAAFAAARKLALAGWIKEGEGVVVLNTGAGIKYPDSVQVNPPLLEIGEFITKR